MKKVPKDENATLEELEGRWPEPDHPTRLVAECHRLRGVRLADLSVEHLRLLIRQNIGVHRLLPFALEQLRKEPLAAGDYYPGDLLCAVLSIDPAYWVDHAALREEVASLANRALQALEPEAKAARRAIQTALRVFSSS